ncbi:MAG: glycine dehydrogenase, partial [Muribaculaceae bacterium]|nr:glycine dehydrogenase [Muribaculaceae bacterium]
MHRYFPHTGEDIRVMLDRCGVAEISDLYRDVPRELTLKAPYDLPDEMSETEVRRHFDELASR